jgi:hypothetical protein
MNHAASTQEWTLGELLTARYMMCRRFCSKRWHWRGAQSTVEFQKTIRAVMARGLGLGIAAAGAGGLLVARHVKAGP